MRYTENDVENACRDKLIDEGLVFIGQQVRIPTGIIDLLFYNDKWGRPVIVEIKKGRTPSSILSQIYGYIWYIQHEINDGCGSKPFHDGLRNDDPSGKPYGIIVAEALDDRTNRAIYYSQEITFRNYVIRNDKFYFPHLWEQDLTVERRASPEDPAIRNLLNITNSHIEQEKRRQDRFTTLNNGGEYDLVLIDDLKVKNNIIWKNNK